MAPGGVELVPWRSQELRGSPELQIPGHPKEEGLLDSLGRLGIDRSDGQISRLLPTLFWRPGGSRRCRAGSLEVPGAQGKPRAPEQWPESSGRGLDNDYHLAFFCQVWSFSVLQGRPSGPRRCRAGSLEVPGVQGKPIAPDSRLSVRRKGCSRPSVRRQGC